MKKVFFILLVLSNLFSCQQPKENNSESKIEDPIILHREHIVNNLTPFYYLKNKIQPKRVEDVMQEYKVPGLRIVFVDKGKISWSKNYGYANLKDSIKIDDKTVFTGASLGKPITSVAALNLAEKGILNLDEDVNNKLKGWKVPTNEFTKKEKVTLRRLIGHTSGFNRYYGSNYMPYEKLPTIEQTLRGEKPSKHPAVKLISVPGSTYRYSNPGYLILEKLMEDVTNKKFEDIIDELVFKPSGMKNSSFIQPIPKRLLATKATGYSENLQPQPYNIITFKAAGGIWTTPDDLAKFTHTLLTDHHKGSHKLVSQKITKEIFNKGGNLKKLGFTLLNWKRDVEDIAFRHTGQNYGFTSVIFGSVEKEQAIIMMANGVNTQQLFDYIIRATAKEYNWDYFKPSAYEIYDNKGKDFNEYAGQYDWKNHFVIITNEHKKLFIQIDNQRHQLIPVDENTFLAPDISLLIILPKKVGGSLVFLDENGDYSRVNKTYK
ncbi:serine hydrolase [uncultured Polaribacter sp.]|uniref:serine hydrolase domain-containing protein n=1 Tax=uncultured Polaribacter sp. TaxID=174711 RepID=UPI00262C8CBB|nr:serine hydrolase domain-containing protein [uncultured Polaribacter sp.]